MKKTLETLKKCYSFQLDKIPKYKDFVGDHFCFQKICRIRSGNDFIQHRAESMAY
jgi:hypothetical protein